MSNITFVDEIDIRDKRVLLRVDFNITLTEGVTIADDARIRQSLPTIEYLLSLGNRIILVSHLDRPVTREERLSLKPVADHLQKLMPKTPIKLINDFTSEAWKKQLEGQKPGEVYLLENIRFYPEEQQNNEVFAKSLAAMADCYVNDAFGVSHRSDASVVGVPKLIPSYGGLLLKKEVEMISKILQNPERPFVAIVGGIKEDKVSFVEKLHHVADHILIGSGMIKFFKGNDKLIFPQDVVLDGGQVKKIEEVSMETEKVLDIGPETEALFGSYIGRAKTIIWAGPVGYFEDPMYKRGTEFIYYCIAQNNQATSIVGGGDTLAAISKKEYLEKITHISTGGGAMLEFIEKGTLPGIEALKR